MYDNSIQLQLLSLTVWATQTSSGMKILSAVWQTRQGVSKLAPSPCPAAVGLPATARPKNVRALLGQHRYTVLHLQARASHWGGLYLHHIEAVRLSPLRPSVE